MKGEEGRERGRERMILRKIREKKVMEEEMKFMEEEEMGDKELKGEEEVKKG